MDTQNLFSLKGRTALITGGSRGIGRMIAEGFLAQGARVYISARKAEACDRTAKELSASGHCVSLPADVSTLDGTKSRVTVPEGTQNGRQFRLKGKGMPVLRSNQVGDLYIQIMIETPQKLTKRQRELLREFEEISSKDNNPESTGFFARMKEFFEG